MTQVDAIIDWRRRMAAAGSPLYVGAGTGGPVLAPPEQAVLVLGPPRSGKTTSLIIPNVLGAPGAVVSTSTKPDVLLATWRRRLEVGRCWLFDPAGTVSPPSGVRPMRWSPVGGCGDWETALLTARAMVGAARPGGQLGEASHWTERAEALLAPLLHAAALSEAGMTQVVRWVNRHDLDTALAALSVAGADLAGDVLTGLSATEDRELSGIWSTTAGVLAAYRSRLALDGTIEPNFDPDHLPGSGDTVYICSPARRQQLTAPLVVALLEQIRAAAYTTAGAVGGRTAGRSAPASRPRRGGQHRPAARLAGCGRRRGQPGPAHPGLFPGPVAGPGALGRGGRWILVPLRGQGRPAWHRRSAHPGAGVPVGWRRGSAGAIGEPAAVVERAPRRPHGELVHPPPTSLAGRGGRPSR